MALWLLAGVFAPQPVWSQSVAAPPHPLDIARLFPTLSADRWVGQKVRFLAAPVRVEGDLSAMEIPFFGWMRVKTAAEIEKETYRHGDVVERIEITPSFSATDYVKSMHGELDGKVATIVSIETVQDGAKKEKIVTVEVDETKRRYTCTAYNGTIGNVVFQRELDAARRFFVGKTLHCHERSLLAFRGLSIVRVAVAPSAPVVVQDVVAATDDAAPLRFLLQTADKRPLFADIHLSGTNIAPAILPYQSFTATFDVPASQRIVPGRGMRP